MRAVVFDFDGLILDTESAIFDVLVEIFAEHGCTIDEAEWAFTIGTHDGIDECRPGRSSPAPTRRGAGHPLHCTRKSLCDTSAVS